MGPHKDLKKPNKPASETFKDKKIKKKKKHKKKHRKRHHTAASPDCEEEKQRKIKKNSKTHDLSEASTDIPVALMSASKSMAPMTKEEWDKRQNETKRVYDEATGRYRLIKGDGEVIEEIVSRDRHKAINQEATRGDGTFFQNQMNIKLNK